MSDPWIIKLIGGVDGIEAFPKLVEHLGRYVVRYQPELAPKGEQWIWTSVNPDEARSFDDSKAFHQWYSQSIGTRPWDGKPDRPITAFHVEAARRSTFNE